MGQTEGLASCPIQASESFFFDCDMIGKRTGYIMLKQYLFEIRSSKRVKQMNTDFEIPSVKIRDLRQRSFFCSQFCWFVMLKLSIVKT